jgi:hypothetical protein
MDTMPKAKMFADDTSTELPPRVALRPDPVQWSDAELMTLQEAAVLFWPLGPLTTTSLRTAVRDGKLEIAEIAGKLLTNKISIAKMSICSVRQPAPSAVELPSAASGGGSPGMPRSVAEYRRMVAEGKI